MSGQHRADGVYQVVLKLYTNIEKQRAIIAQLAEEASITAGAIHALESWNQDLQNTEVSFAAAIPKQWAILIGQYDLALDALRRYLERI